MKTDMKTYGYDDGTLTSKNAVSTQLVDPETGRYMYILEYCDKDGNWKTILTK